MNEKYDDGDVTTYIVVKNYEEQYSILPEQRTVPTGWSAVGPKGKKSVCLDYIEGVWTDMRPLSIRASEG